MDFPNGIDIVPYVQCFGVSYDNIKFWCIISQVLDIGDEQFRCRMACWSM